MRYMVTTGKLAVATAALAVVLLGPGLDRTGAAMAAGGGVELREQVSITINPVKRGDVEAFDAWIAAFRTSVDTLIDEGKLSPADICAYRSWRVLGPSSTLRRASERRPDMVVNYLFVFDPLVNGAEYSMQSHLTTAMGEEESVKRIEAFQAMLADKPVSYLSDPLGITDVTDRSAQCDL